MTDPLDPGPAAQQPAPPDGSGSPPVVAWAAAPPASPEARGSRRVLDIVVWVLALAALVVLSLARANVAGTTGSERVGYVIGSVLFALLISAAARWLWLRARRRGDPLVRFLSPWIPVGAVILAVLALFGGDRS
jgi:hypothetical protein